MMALPAGSWRASGLKLHGETGGLDGFGIMNVQPFFHEQGMWGGLHAHQIHNFSCKSGAKKSACWCQTTPGANGFAVALVHGIILNARANCLTSKGTPGA